MLNKIGHWASRQAKKLTFFISKTITSAVMVLSALAGISSTSGEASWMRIFIAFMVFIAGMPIGLAVFGAGFKILPWFACVVGIIFLMNLHSAWEVGRALKAGGLDYVMVGQTVESVKAVTPSREHIKKLKAQTIEVNERFASLSASHGRFNGTVLYSADVAKRLQGKEK